VADNTRCKALSLICWAKSSGDLPYLIFSRGVCSGVDEQLYYLVFAKLSNEVNTSLFSV
jgi:hypothetical protein